MPSQAIAAARDGDTVRIHPGQYFDCAIVGQNSLTIEGVGSGVVLTDKPCQRKALLVIDGKNVTVRNLTLQRARVPDENGAGIRAEGGNLLVENVQFVDNQEGILAADNPAATIRVISSSFVKDGFCASNRAHAIYVNRFKELDVESSRFFDTQQGHDVKSRALITKVIGCDMEDGPDGTSSYQIDIPNGGTVVVQDNRMQKGPKSGNHRAVAIGEEGVTQPTDKIVMQRNLLQNDTGAQVIFVWNVTATEAQLSGNVFKGGPVRPLVGDGSAR